MCDETLCARPEADQLERVVEPAGGNTVVRLVRRHVVDSMMFTRQDNVKILQDGDVPRQSEVCVGPLVDLLDGTEKTPLVTCRSVIQDSKTDIHHL